MTSAHSAWTSGEVPDFLLPVQDPAASGLTVLAPPLRQVPEGFTPRRSAVLMAVAGSDLDNAALLVEERSHSMRAQPGQFALPGGGVEDLDVDDIHTALREAQEETGLRAEQVRVLGTFAAVPMPWRNYSVRPVIGWLPERPALRAVDPAEVERVVWAPLVGPGSLTDAHVRCRGIVDGQDVGPAYDLPQDAFVWGFTAHLIDALLGVLGLLPPAGSAQHDAASMRHREVPSLRRRPGL